VEEFQPENGVEMDLIDQMVAAQWRLRRIWRMQTAALDLTMDQQEKEIAQKFKQIDQATRATVAFTAMANEHKTLDLFLRYETAYTRMHQRAINTLFKLRKEKLRNDPEPPAAPTPEEANPDIPDFATMLSTPVGDPGKECQQQVGTRNTQPNPAPSSENRNGTIEPQSE
jgi:hypothetical protein